MLVQPIATTSPAGPPAVDASARRLRIAVPAIALLGAAAIVLFVGLRWSTWVGAPGWQQTDDAYLKSDLTPLSAKVGGYVRRVDVSDYQQVARGALLVEIDDDDYRAASAQAQANVAAAEAAIVNNRALQRLQASTIRASIAATSALRADFVRYELDATRQHTLALTAANARQTVELADANQARSHALLEQGEAQVDAARDQLAVLRTQAAQLMAALDAQRAALQVARINQGNTRITAPVAGRVGERLVRPGQLVVAGTQVTSIVPEPEMWVVANFKETQLTHAAIGQRAEIRVDAFPGTVWRGRIDTLSPAAGSQFALLPPDNATGNFTKVVQRVPVKIVFDGTEVPDERLRAGMSVDVRIDTSVRERNDGSVATAPSR